MELGQLVAWQIIAEQTCSTRLYEPEQAWSDSARHPKLIICVAVCVNVYCKKHFIMAQRKTIYPHWKLNSDNGKVLFLTVRASLIVFVRWNMVFLALDT